MNSATAALIHATPSVISPAVCRRVSLASKTPPPTMVQPGW